MSASKNCIIKNWPVETPFVGAGLRRVIVLPLGNKIMGGILRLTGNVVISDVSSSGTAIGDLSPARLINRVFVRGVAKGSGDPTTGSVYPGGDLVSASPRSLLYSSIFQSGGKLILDMNGVTFGATLAAPNAVAGTYKVDLYLPINFADYNRHRPIETALNSDAYDSLTVEVDTAGIANCFSGFAGTVDYSDLKLQWIDQRENTIGDTMALFQEDHTLLIDATNPRRTDAAMPNDGNMIDLQLLCELGATKKLSNALLNRITLNAATADIDLYAENMRYMVYRDEFADASQDMTGVIYLNPTDGLLKGSIGLATTTVVFDWNNVSGSNLDDLLVFSRRFYLPLAQSGKVTTSQTPVNG